MRAKRTDSGRGCGGNVVVNVVVGAVTLGTAHHTPLPLARGTAACGTPLISHAARRTPHFRYELGYEHSTSKGLMPHPQGLAVKVA